VNWVVATLISAALLGCYELSIKHAVNKNAVLPVLFLSNVCSVLVWLTLMGIQAFHPGTLPANLVVAHVTPFQHLELALKSLIVSSSWICSYFAMKHLPVSIASPIRATGPVWTLLGALVVLVERPTLLETLGIFTTIGSFFMLSVAGRGEGIRFARNRWIPWLIGGTILGAISSLYDKYLLGRAGFTASTVQAWFVIYLVVFFFPLVLGWKLRWWTRNEFYWRWSILLISIALLLSDFIYFSALQNPKALISLVASLRRGSTLVAFAGGLWIFGERSSVEKFLAVLGVLVGIILTLMG
jgi:bacterial/archaeal transporter family protein